MSLESDRPLRDAAFFVHVRDRRARKVNRACEIARQLRAVDLFASSQKAKTISRIFTPRRDLFHCDAPVEKLLLELLSMDQKTGQPLARNWNQQAISRVFSNENRTLAELGNSFLLQPPKKTTDGGLPDFTSRSQDVLTFLKFGVYQDLLNPADFDQQFTIHDRERIATDAKIEAGYAHFPAAQSCSSLKVDLSAIDWLTDEPPTILDSQPVLRSEASLDRHGRYHVPRSIRVVTSSFKEYRLRCIEECGRVNEPMIFPSIVLGKVLPTLNHNREIRHECVTLAVLFDERSGYAVGIVFQQSTIHHTILMPGMRSLFWELVLEVQRRTGKQIDVQDCEPRPSH